MKNVILTILFTVLSCSIFSQDTNYIVLQYNTRSTTYYNSSTGKSQTKSSGQMVWKFAGDENWQTLGRRYSNIEPVLSLNPESAKFIKRAKRDRVFYNLALPGTVVFSIGSLFLISELVAKYEKPYNPYKKNSDFAETALPLIAFTGFAVIGSVVIYKFKTRSYDNLALACCAYNRKGSSGTGMVQSLNFDLGFSRIPMQNNVSPQLTFRMALN